MIGDDARRSAGLLVSRARDARVFVATAESCTGGLVAAAITSVDGASAVFGAGYVTYSNEAKARTLGVPEALLAQYGAVSRQVALAMAEGATRISGADIAISVTGIAGPGGGSTAKPVGLVHFATAARGRLVHEEHHFGSLGRDEVRARSVIAALALLHRALDELGR
ncbi:CinA family protein [Aureimonas sp. ME7]|uniref:CinA family protein n=1 Tax=Aureimonas sp. ME7 TaxID=2744252 RepID=UPI0015F5E9C4|nr:CinA family protein [Aureimonas sp. ME7]